jgi:phosphonate transport system substrate-binding protein
MLQLSQCPKTYEMGNQKVIFTKLFFFVLLSSCLNCYGGEIKSDNTRLNIGVYRPSLNGYVDLKDIEISFNYWLQEVVRDLALETTDVNFYDKYQDISTAFARRDIDMFIAPPLAIVMHFDKELIAEGFYSKSERDDGDALLLLARAEKVGSINDMAGKRLILPQHDDLAEIFLEMLALKTYNKGYQEVFSQIKTAPKMNRIILDLFFGTSDVALVYRSNYDVMVEMNSQINDRIKILKSYPVLSKNMTFLHKDYPNRKWIINRIKGLADHPRGQQILNLYGTAKIGISTTDALGPFEQLYKQYLSLKTLVSSQE